MSQSSKKINVAVVGAGYWGPNLVRNFWGMDNASVLGVCDLDPKRLELIKKRYPDINVTSSFDELLADPEVQAVAIATPVASHFSLAKKALLAGKHILVEKPFTRTVAEAEELIALAEKKKLTLLVDHTFLYYGPVLKIKELVDRGDLGELHYFDSQRINLGLIQPDVNVIWDLATHDISILNFIYPKKPVSVSASGTRHFANKAEEIAHVSINYENGFVAHLHISWLAPVKMRHMLIGGSKKMLYFNDIDPVEKIKVYEKGIIAPTKDEDPANPIYRSGDAYIPIFDGSEALLAECEHFIDCIKTGKKPTTDGQSGLAVIRVLEAADKSLAGGGGKVAI